MKINNEKLIRVQKAIVDGGTASGSSLLYGDGKGILFESLYGSSDPENGTPVTGVTMYHMFSMTKVMTVASALMLVERGELGLGDPVCAYIPEYSDIAVNDGGKIRRAKTLMRVRDLFAMTSGLTYLTEDPDGSVAALCGKYRADIGGTTGFARALASVPLAFDPGEGFRYGLSHDVLGALIETVSGATLAEYMKKNIFDPLGMEDTYFYQDLPGRYAAVTAANTAYVNGGYAAIPMPGRPVPVLGETGDRRLYSGGSGAVCTARDYAKFLTAMTCGALLGEKMTELMTSPQLTAKQRSFYNRPEYDASSFGPEHTFALGVRVQDRAGEGSVGEWGWSGALGTWFFVDKRDGLWFLYLHQHTPANHGKYIIPLRNAFYGGE